MNNDRVHSLPFEVVGAGLFVIDVQLNNGQPEKFLIDTGATKSAVFQELANEYQLVGFEDSKVVIHGMTAKGTKPRTTIKNLRIASLELSEFEVVILGQREKFGEEIYRPDGIIGMDVLSDYRIYVDAELLLLHLIPRSLPPLNFPSNWRLIQLKPNPYSEVNYGLNFIELRIGNRLVPALLDTGSEFNIINWDSLHFPQLKAMRKRMREDWLIKGAIGEFDPVSQIKVENFRGGQKWWEERIFYVMNFDNLDILGIEQNPFVIAGGNLLAGNSFYLDFETQMLLIKPDDYDRKVSLGRRDGIVVQVE